MSKTKDGRVYTEAELVARLAERFCKPSWAFFPKVSNATGFNGNRYIDAMALSLWPSQGIHLHGFEIKSHRNDWRRELKNPQKAEDLACYCNFWWVVGAEDVIHDYEVPQNWGWMMPTGRGLRIRSQAILQENKTLDLPFIAALLRRATDGVTPTALIEDKIKAAREQERDYQKHLHEEDELTIAQLRQTIEDFEKASGVEIDQWNHSAKTIGGAVKAVLEGADKEVQRRLAGIRSTVSDLLLYVDDRINENKKKEESSGA